jgi:hypothetical protein
MCNIHWSKSPLARFVWQRAYHAASRLEQPPTPRATPLSQTPVVGESPDVILMAVSSEWSARDLVQRLSRAGLRLELDSANQWHLVAREAP